MRSSLVWPGAIALLLYAFTAAGITLAGEKDGEPTSPDAPTGTSVTGSGGAVSSDEILELKRMLMDQQHQIEELRQELREQKKAFAVSQRETIPGSAPGSGGMTMTRLTPANTYELEITSANAQGEAAKQTLGDAAKAAAPTVAVPTCPPLCAPVKPDQIEWGPNFRIGNAHLTPLGWVDATAIFRDTDPGGNGGTNFGSIPYRNQANVSGNLSEFRFSPQNSRIGARFDSIYKGVNVLGYWESDFLGTVPPNVVVSTNGYSFRLRLIFADLKKNGLEFLGGQSWSLITPGRKGISPLPGDLFYGQVIDWHYLVGLPWGRVPGFRVAYHAGTSLHFAVAVENPEQYIGGSGGGGVVTLPAAFTTTYAGQLNDGTSNQTVPNRNPDIIGKIAFDGGSFLHVEVGALARSFKVYRPDTGQEFTKNGGAFQVNAVIGPKNLKFITTNYWSDGGGRYLFGTAPDLAIRSDGSIAVIKSGGITDGVEITLGRLLLYAYYGGTFIGKYRVTDANNQLVGYGYQGSSNAQNRTIQEGTFGFNQTVWKDPKYGAINLMGQYAYFTRNPWVIDAGAPKGTHMNEVWLNLRYSFPGAPPSVE